MVAVVVTTDTITLYKPDGNSVQILQGHPNVPYIIDTLIPAINANGIGEYDHEALLAKCKQSNVYTEFEAASKTVKFFSLAKRKLVEWFTKESTEEPKQLPEQTVGQVPTPTSSDCTSSVQSKALLDEVMAHATPASSPEFTDNDSENTVVAVVDDKVIPDVQNLSRHLKYANANSPKAMENFFNRISKVIHLRQHSVEDLMKFLRSANLPIAEDGRVIAYKNLRNHSDSLARFVDIHSKKVLQDVGWRVCVPSELVDPDRRTDCSHGLHIANPAYLSSFTGDVCVMVKVAPEDFFAVPVRSTNKARVSSYDILALLTDSQRGAVTYGNHCLTSAEGGTELLAKAMQGELDHMHTQVMVTKHNGRGIKLTRIAVDKGVQNTPIKPMASVPSELVKDTPVIEKAESAPVDPKSIPEKAPEPKNSSAKPLSNRASIMAILKDKTPSMLTQTDIAAINAIRKKAKKSLNALGVPAEFISVIQKK